MIPETRQGAPVFRVTFFFGPERVEGHADIVACVFNVKKRSWKAGVQVAVEIHTNQLAALRRTIELNDRLAARMMGIDPDEVSSYQDRADDLFVQALCRWKLNFRLQAGLPQANQRIRAEELTDELNEGACAHHDDIFAYLVDELGLIADGPTAPQ